MPSHLPTLKAVEQGRGSFLVVVVVIVEVVILVILTESTFHSTDTCRSTGNSFLLLGTLWRIERSDVHKVKIKGGTREDDFVLCFCSGMKMKIRPIV